MFYVLLTVSELDGNNVDDDYEYPGYNTEMGWSNGKVLLVLCIGRYILTID